MNKLNSPWLEEIVSKPEFPALTNNYETDVLVIGGGLAGVTTAYFILKNTDFKVTIVEAREIASGASGNNAGQVVNGFERPFSDIAAEFGWDHLIEALHNGERGFELIRETLEETKINVDYSERETYLAFDDIEATIDIVEDYFQIHQRGLPARPIYVDQNVKEQISQHLHKSIDFVSSETIREKLRTKKNSYIAAVADHHMQGAMNTALFSVELLRFMTQEFSDRITVYENTNAEEIELFRENTKVFANNHMIQAMKVVLCTNGYTGYKITNHIPTPENIEIGIKGYVGYMVGYYGQEPIKDTVVYFDKAFLDEEETYYYRNMRKYQGKVLSVLGGEGKELEKEEQYNMQEKFPDKSVVKYKEFIEAHDGIRKGGFDHKWHGLLGYTNNLLRIVGPDLHNPNLIYNLGCNGIAILYILWGGERISKVLNGKKFEMSLFDPNLDNIRYKR